MRGLWFIYLIIYLFSYLFLFQAFTVGVEEKSTVQEFVALVCFTTTTKPQLESQAQNHSSSFQILFH